MNGSLFGKLATLWAEKRLQVPNDIGDQLNELNDGVIVPIKQWGSSD
jgi:hypothetical protein